MGILSAITVLQQVEQDSPGLSIGGDIMDRDTLQKVFEDSECGICPATRGIVLWYLKHLYDKQAAVPGALVGGKRRRVFLVAALSSTLVGATDRRCCSGRRR